MATRLSNVAPPAGGLATVFIPFGEITKATENGVDVRIVKGPMTDESLDKDKQIVDYDWAAKAAQQWHSRWGNIREQHSTNAIGKSVELALDADRRLVDLTGKIIDPTAILKVDEQVLSGWSVGIKGARIVKDAKAPNGRIVGGDIVEVSLVDHPANENCKVALVKSADGDQLVNAEQAVVEKGNAPGGTAQSPLMGGLIANVEGGLNERSTAPAGKQTPLPADTAGDDLDTTPGSALRRKKKPTPEVGGSTAGQAGRQTPKAANPVGGTHGHLHIHNAGTDQEYSHDHGHDHEEGLHGDGDDGDHQHDHTGKSAKPDATKGSIVPGQAAPNSSGEGIAQDVTSPSGATAGDCPDNSCTCGGCGPSCEGTCCAACTMGDDYDRRESLHFGANAEYLKFVEGDLWKRDFSSAERKRLAGEGKALPDGSFPIANEQDLHNAIRAIGRASNPAAAKKHIKARAAAMGMTDALPDDWKSAIATTTKKSTSPEEALEMSYANAAPHIKAALEAGDSKAALALMQAAEIVAAKGSIIAGQAGGTDDSDGVETVPQPASGKKKRTTPEQGGAGAPNAAPESEDVAPTKAVTAETMKAVLSEVTKAVDTAVKPLADKIAQLEKRAQPGGPSLTGLRQLSAPEDAKSEMFKTALGNLSIEQLEDLAQNYPDGQIRLGFKELLADVKKSA